MNSIFLDLWSIWRVCRKANILSCVFMLICLLFVGCATKPLRYNDLVRQIDKVMLSGRILAESDCEWPLEVFQADSELARSMKVLKISSDIKTITLSTDERGRIFFPVQGDLRRENPRIKILEQDKFKRIKKFHVIAPPDCRK